MATASVPAFQVPDLVPLHDGLQAVRSFQKNSPHQAVLFTVGTRRKLAVYGTWKFYSLAQFIPSPTSPQRVFSSEDSHRSDSLVCNFKTCELIVEDSSQAHLQCPDYENSPGSFSAFLGSVWGYLGT
ncbi:rCG27711 [Rattus norvegicus]|uniref:RCG27711 n=1 Tax=Rattus norvegicus TaxID=10116 RepID=A6KBE8_RAT|nr:rCG27711 [Rattus norvegicus]